MTQNRNNSRRCDSCGRLSSHPLGEYTRNDGSAGYINCQGQQDSDQDFCDDCVSLPSPKAAAFLAKIANLPDDDFDRTIAMIFRPIPDEERQ